MAKSRRTTSMLMRMRGNHRVIGVAREHTEHSEDLEHQ